MIHYGVTHSESESCAPDHVDHIVRSWMKTALYWALLFTVLFQLSAIAWLLLKNSDQTPLRQTVRNGSRAFLSNGNL
jgi:hypothetical protein